MPSRPISANPKTSNIFRSKVILLAITLSAAAIFLVTIVYFLYHLWYTLRQHGTRTSPFDSSTPLKLQKFTYKELKSATNGFNPDHIIGKGGSGTVFRGVMRDGKSVAVKKLDCSSCNSVQVDKEFQSELTILGAIRSPHIVSLLGYCVDKNKKVLVYEYMPNGSLQELLFSEVGSLCMSWEKRFQVMQDVSRAIEFLHNDCDPPVIHGDIKPSNVLLDWDFRAKISDFGLSRVKVDEDFGVEMFSQEIGRSQELSGNLNVETQQTNKEVKSEVDFALALQASCSTKNGKGNLHSENVCSPSSLGCNGKASPKGKEVILEDGVCSYDHELSSVEHSKELDAKQWGKDWWWKQDGSGELSSKDYVNEWIGSQICESTNADWESSPIESTLGNPHRLDTLKEETVCRGEKGFEEKENGGNKNSPKVKPKKMQDWWKEEERDEMSKRGRKLRSLKKMRRGMKMAYFDLGRHFYCLKRRRLREDNHIDGNLNHEFGFKRVWKRKHSRSMGSEMSGDLFSRELSSTTSMRGTLCYIAPEYGGCGYLVEKGDIYSLGVFILVIISGRRPLHVLNSPMKLEKANLVSWCRHLAQAGNVLELVDDKLKDAYNSDQAIMCIHLALACLQRVPELRPDIGDIVKILKGELELPPLPFEFSPSPPAKCYNKSRKKRNNTE